MIRDTPELARFEREYARERARTDDYARNLAIFTALWVEAAALSDDFPPDWETAWKEDVEADIELARVLNGLDSRS